MEWVEGMIIWFLTVGFRGTFAHYLIYSIAEETTAMNSRTRPKKVPDF